MLIGIALSLGLGILVSGVALAKSFSNGIAILSAQSAQETILGKRMEAITPTVLLPLLLYGYPPPPPEPAREIGTATLITGPVNCSGQDCYTLQIDCPDLGESILANVKVGESTVSQTTGTVLFTTGFFGGFLWEARGGEAPRVLDDLRAAGFRTVQLAWDGNWFKGQWNKYEGTMRLACRPATVAQWVYDHLASQNANTPYCATGWSNGASQVAYPMTHYGFENIFDSVLFESGPNWARTDTGCLHNDPSHPTLWFSEDERELVDYSFGYFPGDTSGPCYQEDAAQVQLFSDNSLALGNRDFKYPHTQVDFLFGDQDTTSTAAQGMYFYNWLSSHGTPLLSVQTVPGVGHGVIDTTAGADILRDTLINSCKIH